MRNKISAGLYLSCLSDLILVFCQSASLKLDILFDLFDRDELSVA